LMDLHRAFSKHQTRTKMRHWDYYELPGPSAFLDRIEEDIQQEGRSIVLKMGRFAPMGWLEELNRRLCSDSDYWHWTHIDTAGDTPLAGLTKGAEKGRRIISEGNLYDLEGFGQRIFVVEPHDAAAVATWLDFLPKFADITRPQPLFSRSAVLLSVPSGLLCQVAENVMIKSYSFQGSVTPVDMLIYAYQHIPETARGGVLRNLRAQLSMEFSLWDFGLCKELAPLSVANLVEPTVILKRYAEKVGFQELVAEEDNDRLTDAGVLGLFEGEERIHSAMLALRNDFEGIKQRVWRAQLRVLYPFVEEHRQKIITKYTRLIKLPHTRRDGSKVGSLPEMEIGDIKVNLDQNRREYKHRMLKDFIRNLWVIRKTLAHLDVVPAKYLTERDMDWDYAGNHD